MTGRPGGRLAITIVGGGASGVLLAAHLLQDADADIRVTLIEKRAAFGQGLAYSTPLDDHILNVSALGMSAYADDPEHFWRWLKGRGRVEGDEPRVYVPRTGWPACPPTSRSVTSSACSTGRWRRFPAPAARNTRPARIATRRPARCGT